MFLPTWLERPVTLLSDFLKKKHSNGSLCRNLFLIVQFHPIRLQMLKQLLANVVRERERERERKKKRERESRRMSKFFIGTSANIFPYVFGPHTQIGLSDDFYFHFGPLGIFLFPWLQQTCFSSLFRSELIIHFECHPVFVCTLNAKSLDILDYL